MTDEPETTPEQDRADKKARRVSVPVVLEPDREQAVLETGNALKARSQELLETTPGRVRAVREEHGADVVKADKAVSAMLAADRAEVAELKRAADEAEAALREVVVYYVFAPIGWKAWKNLKGRYPSKDDKKSVDVEAIAEELLQLASYEPKLSATDVEDLLASKKYSAGEIDLLINGAIAAQT